MKELKVSEWSEELSDGLKYRRKYGLEDHWGSLEAMLYGTHPSQQNSGPNIFLSTLDALAASMNVPLPYVTVKARRSEALMKARVLESTDNMLLDLMGVQREMESVITNCFLYSRGFVKIGYDSEFGWDDTLDLGLADPGNHGKPLGITMSQYDKTGQRIEYNNFEPGMPWVKSVMPHDIIVPWGTFEINDSPWIAHRVVRHIEAVREDMKYDAKVAKSLRPNMSMEDFVRSYQTAHNLYRIGQDEQLTVSEGPQEYVELWEIRDRRTGKILVMATGQDERWLRNEPDSLQLRGLPFASMSFIPRARNFWTTPDAFYLRYHQAELSDIAVQTTKHRRLSIAKFLYKTEAMTETAMNALFSAEIGAGIPIDGGHNLNDVIMPLNVQTPNFQLYSDAEAVRRNAREQVGFSKNQVGEFESSGRRTAREVMEVAQAAGLRLDRRQNKLREMYVDIIKHVNAIIQENWKTPRVVEVVGERGQPAWYNVTGDSLRGEYNYQLGFSVGGNETLQERRSMALQMFGVLSQDQRFDPMKLGQWLANAINDPEFSATYADGVLNGQAGGQGMQLPQGGGGVPARQQAVPMGGGAAGAPALGGGGE